MVLGDAGRVALSPQIRSLLESDTRVLAIDPFYFGESKIKSRDFLFGLLVSAVGERPLGIQASQVSAISSWIAQRHPQPVKLLATGPRTSVIVLVAAALSPTNIASVDVRGAHGSLKEIIAAGMGANQTPELFCFGLLEEFDVLQITALSAPRPVRFHEPSDRAKEELKQLARFYQTLGSKFDPLR